MAAKSPVVRTADATEDALTVRRILDAAVLEVDGLDSRLESGNVLVATVPRTDGDDASDRLLGVIVLDPRPNDSGAHVGAIAVRRRHRANGIGTALVEAALEREGRLTACFDEGVRPFYDALGFSSERLETGRYRGVCEYQPGER